MYVLNTLLLAKCRWYGNSIDGFRYFGMVVWFPHHWAIKYYFDIYLTCIIINHSATKIEPVSGYVKLLGDFMSRFYIAFKVKPNLKNDVFLIVIIIID